MSLRYVVLASLSEDEASGYELAQRCDVSVANFWHATSQQVYLELKKLEQDGWVEAETVIQQHRPNKRVFSLTPAGREQLDAWIGSPSNLAAVKDDLMVKIQASTNALAPSLIEQLRERILAAKHKLALYNDLREKLLAGRNEDEYLQSARRIGPYLTLLRGIGFEKDNLKWYEKTIAALSARSSSSKGKKPKRVNESAAT
jgi:DNA-binding PadR family transcriptional regulator